MIRRRSEHLGNGGGVVLHLQIADGLVGADGLEELRRLLVLLGRGGEARLVIVNHAVVGELHVQEALIVQAAGAVVVLGLEGLVAFRLLCICLRMNTTTRRDSIDSLSECHVAHVDLLLKIQQLHVEVESRVGGNVGTRAGRSVGIFGLADENRVLSLLHRGETDIPALNHESLSKLEVEGLVAVSRTVELLSVLQSAGIVG